ncbi:HAD hydrolase-like protein [Shewanella sp. Isolate7]|uniref:HAD family hydrolase n=1 Tax=Shewanella sp. Isolate7 TaxID=2908528 RepID=UPI001EFEDBA4|nr:HAD hydrolase-like protein [Shewanella sp. Isolate7]MCG9723417.1 HAD hydrolase-like protein [Shewanella sp. Isolate7]
MHLLSEYEVYIFDCDGVILNSNQLKIEAMKNALEAHFSSQVLINECVNYFRQNFGKSRFHHVSHFLDNIFEIDERDKDELEQFVLNDFSKQCRTLYLSAELTPNFIEFLEQCEGKRYVASGSEQNELRDVFKKRCLDIHFDGVFGSPRPKAQLIQDILQRGHTTNAVMFGDAESDLLSAKQNNIDFVFYSPFSNVKEKMIKLCDLEQYMVIDDFSNARF